MVSLNKVAITLVYWYIAQINVRSKNTGSSYNNDECHTLRLWSIAIAQQLNQCTVIVKAADVIFLSIASSFHVDHELVDFVPVGEPEYDEVIEEYEEEIFAQEDAQEPIGVDPADPAPTQGKPRCITPIFK